MFSGCGFAFQLRWPRKISLGCGMAIRCPKNDDEAPQIVDVLSESSVTAGKTASTKDLLDPYELLHQICRRRRTASQPEPPAERKSFDSGFDGMSKEKILVKESVIDDKYSK
ncbi:hypothetical protein FGG08_000012 [Glutinoglossum americanum]|uniref:Uncharacterized protein n=1 Tax=Glutinoglossum americanum TaxID=1670608 RepID=A0A9P8L433_9PEZI|nr:hypothetical protein FGG08_000012 [Glutinoglossum americanum]